MFCAWKTACQIFLQATLLARDELTGSLVQVLLLAVGFEQRIFACVSSVGGELLMRLGLADAPTRAPSPTGVEEMVVDEPARAE